MSRLRASSALTALAMCWAVTGVPRGLDAAEGQPKIRPPGPSEPSTPWPTIPSVKALADQVPSTVDFFELAGSRAFLIRPRGEAGSSPMPWVWYAPVIGHPNASHAWMLRQWLDKGIGMAGVDVGESYGSPQGREVFTALWETLTARYGMSERPCLLPQSRGGLMLYNWAAENPERVACIAGIYTVCDLVSYPGLEKASGAYGMSAADLEAHLAEHNPIDRLAPLAKAGVLILHIHGDADRVVPLERNSGELAQRYRALGGQAHLIVIPGKGHQVCPEFFQCQELVDFVIAHAMKSVKTSLASLAALIAVPAAGNEETVTFRVEVDLGKDRGQSFGSLFEARNGAGRVVAGAGFQDVYNTRFRGDRHTLQFFVRPEADDRFALSRLAHPDLDCGVYLFDLDEEVYAWSSVRDNSVRRWDESSGAWRHEMPPGCGQIRSGDGVMRLGAGRLTFSGDEVRYNGTVILAGPAVGGYYSFYYAQGWLCFYHRNHSGSESFTRIYACRWSPDDEGAVDLSKAVVLKTKYDVETPFAWGQFEDQILTVSNMGGIYVFEDSKWRTALEALDTESYQVYSMLHWHDRLLLAQYPTGNLFEYQGGEAKRIEGWPPTLPGVSPSARECQTLAIYRGDLVAGVWPWAELWRYDRDAKQWHSMGRMFTHPEPTDATVHPYESEAKEYGLVINHWGQRVTGLVPRGDSLFVSTSSKGTSAWDARYTFLTDQQRREYGAVLRLRMPGNLATQIEWKDRPIRLTFQVSPGRLAILQDGQELAATTLEGDFAVDFSGVNVSWGRGVFGPLRGEMRSRECLVE